MTSIYFIRCGEFVKIGKGDDPEDRLSNLQCGNPHELELMGYFEGTPEEEIRIHTAFKQFRHRGEWFFLTETIRDFIAQAQHARLEQTSDGKVITMAKMRADFRAQEMLDHIGRFIEERTTRAWGTSVGATALYFNYLAWCAESNLLAATVTLFGRVVTQMDFQKRKSNGCIFYCGIELRGDQMALAGLDPDEMAEEA